MGFKKKKGEENKYNICGDFVEIIIIRRNKTVFKTLVDLEDFDRVKQKQWHVWYYKDKKSWYARAMDYQTTTKRCNTIMLHRFIVNVEKKFVVDHYDHDTLNNRKYNLRVAEKENNEKHRKSKNSNNKSGYRNVCWDNRKNCWIVQLMVNGRNTCLGEFDDVNEAGEFAEEKRKELYGEFAGEN